MTKYLLECPECDARFELLKYEPEKRVRCRKCDTVVVIPYAPGHEPAGKAAADKPLDPELKKKLVRMLSLRKLGLVAFLLALAASGGFYILVKKREAGPASPPAPPEERITLQKVPTLNRTLVLPLGMGFSWEYALSGGGTEIRQVVQAGLSPDGEPEFDLVMRGASVSTRQSLRIRNNGLFLSKETRSDGTRDFNPPVLYVPYPMFAKDPWTQSGEGVKTGVEREAWKVECAPTLIEWVETPAGKFNCFRVELKGVRGGRAVEEIHWYAIGIGLVKRQTTLESGVEEAILKKYTQR